MSTENQAVEVRCNLLVIRSRQIDQAASFYEALGLRFAKHRVELTATTLGESER